ncbi:MAG: sigma-54-dependent Fis family transcriptional regulator [Myxococcales bacterium]|nr:sigma-54-dependent Fis family transcriptional regulator [Myxococcales bacterium]
MKRVLIVDDEPSMREILSLLMRRAGCLVESVASGDEAISLIEQDDFDVVFTDLKMPGSVDGIGVLKCVRRVSSSTQVVILTAFATTETAIEAMKLGAYDYVQKPFKNKEIEAVLEKSLEKRALLQENSLLRDELRERYQFGNLLGKSDPMKKVFDLMRKVIDTKVNVLVLGESGTGKELVARALHYNSQRKERPFVAINCGAIPESLLESELFGHVKGAFTGADRDKIGLFQLADGGTLFLDEIGEMPLALQVKLLRVLQDRCVRPLGAQHDISLDVRLIAATNRNLKEEVRLGRFREDLFFRLNVLSIHMPALRERTEDIPLLAQSFLARAAQELQRPIRSISREAMELLLRYDYPGNVRELQNIMERAVLLATGEEILPEFLLGLAEQQTTLSRETPFSFSTLPPEGLESFLASVEREILLEALHQADGIRKEAAKLLQISFRSLRYRLSKLEIALDGDE